MIYIVFRPPTGKGPRPSHSRPMTICSMEDEIVKKEHVVITIPLEIDLDQAVDKEDFTYHCSSVIIMLESAHVPSAFVGISRF